MVKTLPFHCRGCRFKPLVRELRSCRHSVAKKKKKKKERERERKGFPWCYSV